jgi:hypothetical protein
MSFELRVDHACHADSPPGAAEHNPPLLAARSLFFFRRQRQSEHRDHSLPGDVHLRLFGTRQIERLAIFATVNLGVFSPRFFRIATSPLHHVGGIEPALQMTAASFAFIIFLVAGALPILLYLHLVIRELRGSLWISPSDFAGSQTSPRSRGAYAAGFSLTRHCTRTKTVVRSLV